MLTARRTFDRLVNLLSHIGDARDKQAYSQFEYVQFSEQELTAAYRGWLPNKIANIIPEDMVREGRTVSVTDADTNEFTDFADDLDVLGQLAAGYTWGRLYGGGGVYMVVGEEDPTTPLNLDKVSPQNPLTSLVDFDRYDVEVKLNENPRAPNFMRPEWYKFANDVTQIHWTRVLGPFDGYRLPKREQKLNMGWGGSEVEKISEVALQSLSANASVASVLHRANSLLMGVKGLLNKTASTSKTQELQRRFELASLMMSNNSFTLYDMEHEAPANMTTSLQSPIGAMTEFLSVVAAAADIPVSRFFGTAPKGLNATGEGDRKNYHMSVRGKQKKVFDPALRRLDPIIMRSVYGRELDYGYFWNPLDEETPLEKAQTGVATAQQHRSYFDMGVITASIIAKELQTADAYQAIDEEYVNALEQLETGEDGDDGDDIPEENEPDGDQPEEAPPGTDEE